MKGIHLKKSYVDFHSFEYNYFNNRIILGYIKFLILIIIAIVTNVVDQFNNVIIDD